MPSLFRTWKALFRLGIVQQSSPCVIEQFTLSERLRDRIRMVRPGRQPLQSRRWKKTQKKTKMHAGQHYDENLSTFSCTSLAGCNHRDTR